MTPHSPDALAIVLQIARLHDALLGAAAALLLAILLSD